MIINKKNMENTSNFIEDNKKQEILSNEKENILLLADIEEIKNKMNDSMGYGSISGGLQDRIIEISRIFLGGSDLSEDEKNKVENKTGRSLYEIAIKKFYSEYQYGTDAQKINASNYFKSIIEALRAANNPIQNISKGIWTKLGFPLAAAGITLASGGTGIAAMAIGGAGLGWNSLSYNMKNTIISNIDTYIINNDAIGKKWYEKVETLAGPVGWGIKGIRKSIGGLLGWGKAGIKGGVVAGAVTAEIAGGIPGLKGSLGKVTNGLSGKAYSKLFGK